MRSRCRPWTGPRWGARRASSVLARASATRLVKRLRVAGHGQIGRDRLASWSVLPWPGSPRSGRALGASAEPRARRSRPDFRSRAGARAEVEAEECPKRVPCAGHAKVADHPAHSRSVPGLVLDDPAILLGGHLAAQEHLTRPVHGQLEISPGPGVGRTWCRRQGLRFGSTSRMTAPRLRPSSRPTREESSPAAARSRRTDRQPCRTTEEDRQNRGPTRTATVGGSGSRPSASA